jgi:hypothetical protein
MGRTPRGRQHLCAGCCRRRARCRADRESVRPVPGVGFVRVLLREAGPALRVAATSLAPWTTSSSPGVAVWAATVAKPHIARGTQVRIVDGPVDVALALNGCEQSACRCCFSRMQDSDGLRSRAGGRSQLVHLRSELMGVPGLPLAQAKQAPRPGLARSRCHPGAGQRPALRSTRPAVGRFRGARPAAYRSAFEAEATKRATAGRRVARAGRGLPAAARSTRALRSSPPPSRAILRRR